MDTAKDSRILLFEDAIQRLNNIVNNRKLRMHVEYGRLSTVLQTAGTLLYEVKYSYMEAKLIANLDAMKKIISAIEEFSVIIDSAVTSSDHKSTSAKDQILFAEIDYSLRIINGIQKRLCEYDDDPAHAVDILAIEISQTKPIPESKNLTECRCTDGSRIWNVVTNIQDVKPRMCLACAILPPVEMMGSVSEAMFLGGESLSESVSLGLLKDPPTFALDQARAQVLQITKRMS